MRVDTRSQDQKYWDGVLAANGLAVISTRKLPGAREIGDPIIGCPNGRTSCPFHGGSCEQADSCAMPATGPAFQS
jgi:hypothetical protein